MKTFFISLMFIAVAGVVGANAQQVDVFPRVYVENLYNSERIVKNAPFSAAAVSENIQALADGNRIVRRSSSKIFRDGEGRYRREDMPKQLGVANQVIDIPESILILDPVGGFIYTLNPKESLARKSPYRHVFAYSVKPEMELKLKAELDAVKVYTAQIQKDKTTSDDDKVKAERDAQRADKIAARTKEMEARQAERAATMAERKAELENVIRERAGGAIAIGIPRGTSSKYETKSESLGVQNIEGVQAEGTRSTTTIPAGAIGNERPIDIVYEKWYSKDLQMIVMSKHSDPRSGEQVYRLTDIRLGEPASNLFSPPAEYRVVESSTPRAATVITAKPATVVKVAPIAPTTPASPKRPNEQ